MGATPSQRYGASNAHLVTYVEYAPDPARPVWALMRDIASRLIIGPGRRGGHVYPPGPGTPEVSFTGYATPGPVSMPRSVIKGLGAGLIYPDTALDVMAAGVADSGYGDVTRALFADRLRAKGVQL